MPLTKIYQQVQDCVVQVLAIENDKPVSFGSGSVINSGNMVLTCEHCIINGAKMAICNPKARYETILGKVIFLDKSKDIAIIEFPQVIGTPIKFANSNTCSIGNGAFVVGYPMGVEEQTLFSAHIASLKDEWIRIDASVNHGNSGGPLFGALTENKLEL